MTKLELEALISQGEGLHLEFKESINSGIAKELTAFANTRGGIVLIGIDDLGKIKHKPWNNVDLSKVQSIARDCDPAIGIDVEKVEEIDNVLIVTVEEGLNKPYRCTSGFYVREGASSVKRTTSEIFELFKNANRFTFDDKLVPDANFSENYNPSLFNQFLQKSGIKKVLSDEDTICNLGCAEYVKGKYIFNNTGILFFSDSVIRFNRHAIIQCVKYQGNDKIDIEDQQDLKKDLITNIEEALLFVKKHLSVAFKFETGKAQRIEEWEVPYIALKEAIVNAVAHRDYVDKGTHIQLEIYDDRVSITNYGGLKKGFGIDDLGKRSYHRNPNIVDLLHRANYIEKLGTGILRINRELVKIGLPKAKFDVNEYWFTITFERKNVKQPDEIPALDIVLNTRDISILNACKIAKSRKEVLEDLLGVTNRTKNYEKNMEHLVSAGLLNLTNPDVLTDPSQKYHTSALGLRFLVASN